MLKFNTLATQPARPVYIVGIEHEPTAVRSPYVYYRPARPVYLVEVEHEPTATRSP